MLVEDPKIKPLKKRSLETFKQVPDKKLNPQKIFTTLKLLMLKNL